MHYNELGQLRKKLVGAAVDSLQFDYSFCGWLTGVNKDFVSGTSTSGWFGETLFYYSSFAGARYDGNAARVRWKAGGDGVARGYGFSYDRAGRLTAAAFNSRTAGAAPGLPTWWTSR